LKYAAVFRSLLEASSILCLTLLLADDEFSRLMAEIYPIYFFANVFFGAATIDFAGGRLQLNLTRTLTYLFTPTLLLILLLQENMFFVIIFLLASFTSVEAVSFVFLEAFSNKLQTLALLLPRVLFALFLASSLLFVHQMELETILTVFLLRDLSLVVIGGTLLYHLRHKLFIQSPKRRIILSELTYMLISVAQEHVLRITVNGVLGLSLMKELEYALRVPKLLQTGLMLTFRHRLFLSDFNRDQSYWALASQLFMLIASTVLLCAYVLDKVGPFMLIGASSLLATSAVIWYTDLIGERQFNFLTLVVLFSFCVTFVAIIIIPDAYIAGLLMNFALCLSAFVSGLVRKYA
jgi:hypothetical protein